MLSVFAVYKPRGISSYDVIRRIKKITGISRVGHAGTLDPLARGVLVVGIGRDATRLLKNAVLKEKEYVAKIRLGVESSTDDGEGEKTILEIKHFPSRINIEGALLDFHGQIEQVPPAYSAVKISGRRAYKLARKGVTLELKPRKVVIYSIEALNYVWPNVGLRVVTGPGVYVRSIARDLGGKLGVGGYLYDLERVRVGEFTKDNAIPFDKLEEYLKNKSYD